MRTYNVKAFRMAAAAAGMSVVLAVGVGSLAGGQVSPTGGNGGNGGVGAAGGDGGPASVDNTVQISDDSGACARVNNGLKTGGGGGGNGGNGGRGGPAFNKF
jgi:hypothetical protein